MIATKQAVESFLGSVSLSRKVHTFRNLSFIKIRGTESWEKRETPYVTLQSALQAGQAAVQETGSIECLKLVQQTPQLLFVMAGMYLRGGSQDRTVTHSMVIDSTEAVIPTRCVEHRRWDYSMEPFQVPKQGALAASSFISSSHYRQQQHVWDTVDNLSASIGTETNTSRLGDVVEQASLKLEDFRSNIKLGIEDPDVVGCLFFISRGTNMPAVSMVDIFGQHALAAAMMPPLFESAALHALAFPGGTSPSDADVLSEANALLRNSNSVQAEDIRIQGNSGGILEGPIGPASGKITILSHDYRPLHFMIRA